MYQYRKRTNRIKKIMIIFILITTTSAASILIYDMYANIDVYSTEQQNNNEVSRVVYNQNEVESINEDITTVLEDTIISKIKNTGSSIFLNNSTSNLGLGTGMIVSESGYILTNWHVAGDKYSNCYVTLENGKTISGSVVWADKDLDLSIVKISASNLKYITLGDSDNIKIGQKAYAIGNPIGVEFQR